MIGGLPSKTKSWTIRRAAKFRARIKDDWERINYQLARPYRACLRNACFIGVTGSCGKTTTNEIIGAILSSRYRGRTSHQLYNGPHHVAKTIFTVFPWHQFCVHELGGSYPGTLARTVKVFQPHVGVVTHIGYDHYRNFRSLEATASEKGTLVAALPVKGTAVLNADDPHVLAMRERTRVRVITYGLSQEAMVRGEEISCAWPERLSLTVVYGSARVHIRTRLLGEHWSYAVLAGLATGMALGVPLEDGARAVESMEPVEGRMRPNVSADGVTFIDDTWKAPLWTIPASLKFIQMAQARRKIVIIGTISDYAGAASPKYVAVARKALEIADKVIFVGPLAHCALKARAIEQDERLLAFERFDELNSFLNHDLTSGDLVLLKGSRNTDHLERLVLARSSAILPASA
jgi:UDP-N-acetylmuramoyl-tripeptide--D-alanyl-D-alanine ligase